MRAHFACFGGCDGQHALTTPLYRCPTCSGLLEVRHDLEALAREHDGEGWKRLFEERFRSGPWPLGSGVWGKHEWVSPELPLEMVVSTGEGGTPLLPTERLGRELGMPRLHVKQCGTSHTGSFKDLGMTMLVSTVRAALQQGTLKARVMACASTGDTSAALAAYGALAGIPVVVLLPKGLVSSAQLVQPMAHGAKVLALTTDFDGCMRVIQELARREVIYLANSMNPLRIEGQKTVAIEVTQQLGWRAPDWMVLPSGNLGNAAALHGGFWMMLKLGLIDRMPRLCVAQAENANPLYRAFRDGRPNVEPVVARRSLASAIQIGNPVSAPRAMAALADMRGVVEQASEDELSDACALADRAGVYADPHTGVALACATKLRKNGVIREDEVVVVVSTASALKFTEAKVGYHEGTLEGVTSRHANMPVTLPPDVDAVTEVLRR